MKGDFGPPSRGGESKRRIGPLQGGLPRRGWGVLLSVKDNPSAAFGGTSPSRGGESKRRIGPPARGAAPEGLGGVAEREG